MAQLRASKPHLIPNMSSSKLSGWLFSATVVGVLASTTLVSVFLLELIRWHEFPSPGILNRFLGRYADDIYL